MNVVPVLAIVSIPPFCPELLEGLAFFFNLRGPICHSVVQCGSGLDRWIRGRRLPRLAAAQPNQRSSFQNRKQLGRGRPQPNQTRLQCFKIGSGRAAAQPTAALP